MENNETQVMNVSGKEKAFAILAYVGFLWFLGMLPTNVRESEYLKNHVNNGMVLFICEMILACVPFVGWHFAKLTLKLYQKKEIISIFPILLSFLQNQSRISFLGIL